MLVQLVHVYNRHTLNPLPVVTDRGHAFTFGLGDSASQFRKLEERGLVEENDRPPSIHAIEG